MTPFRAQGSLRPALLLLALPVILLIALLLLGLQAQPSVPRNLTVDGVAITAIEDMLVDRAPARVGRAGELQLQLDESELNLLAAFALQNIPALRGAAARVSVGNQSAALNLSVPLPWSGPALFLNLHIDVAAVDGLAVPGTLWIGRIPVPGAAMRLVAGAGERWLASSYVNFETLRPLRDSVRDVDFSAPTASFTLNWEPQLMATVQNQAEQLLLSADDKARIEHYRETLAVLLAAVPADTRSIALGELLPALFREALVQSAAGADPAVENRSVLQALSLYINADTAQGSGERHPQVTLQRRSDLAQHFVSSAAMTASVGPDVASLLATSKEAHDARYRSGFSFSDLTANMAGVALGDAATLNAASARRLQQALAHSTAESDYMPVVSRDNAGLSEEDFLEQFQDRNSPAYLERLGTINAQLAALPVFNQP
jgi:hypothetical protein